MARFSELLGARTPRLVSSTLILMLAVACGAGQRPTTVRPSTVRPTTRPSVVTAAPRPIWTLVPQVKRKKFLAALKAIDRSLAAEGDAALTHAVDICFKKYDGTPDRALETYASAAYSGGTATISAATARKIVTAAKKWICPAGTLYRRWES